jgi:hypothetical protein
MHELFTQHSLKTALKVAVVVTVLFVLVNLA